MSVWMLLFLLLAGHALCDYPLQSDFMAREKTPLLPTDPARIQPGLKSDLLWFWVLSAHALVHGGCVALLTGSAFLGLAETLSHWFIDILKCIGKTTLTTDQLLHVGCKLLWLGCWAAGR